jgi:hypothetical protein
MAFTVLDAAPPAPCTTIEEVIYTKAIILFYTALFRADLADPLCLGSMSY